MDCSTPVLPVHHQLLEFTETHVHWVGDATQPSHPLLFPSALALNLSKHQGFPMGQFFASGGQSTGVSASTSVLPMNTQDWSPLEWTGWISLQPGTLKSSLQQHGLKASILWHSAFFIAQLSHPYMTPGKTIALTRWTFVGKVSFLGGIQHSPVDGCSAASCNLWSSQRRWALVLLLCHLVVKGIEH